jgi:hypothetical protein
MLVLKQEVRILSQSGSTVEAICCALLSSKTTIEFVFVELLQKEHEMNKFKGQMYAIEAPLYQSYNVYILNKVRAKTEVYLGKFYI